MAGACGTHKYKSCSIILLSGATRTMLTHGFPHSPAVELAIRDTKSTINGLHALAFAAPHTCGASITRVVLI